MPPEDALTAKLKEIFDVTLTERILLGVSDDCAIIKAGDSYVTTTDILVQDAHFKLDWSTPVQIARRALMQNLADIAAMGARPVAIQCGLVIPDAFEEGWILEFAHGLRDEALKQNVAVVGGDLVSGKELAVSITAYGDLGGHAPWLRSGAKTGDILAVCGEIGVSVAGFSDMQKGMTDTYAASRYLVPTPPLQAVQILRNLDVHACMDVSDGLVKDVERMMRASNTSAKMFPYNDVIRNIRGGAASDLTSARFIPSEQQYYFGGEDHGLLISLSQNALETDEIEQLRSDYGFVTVGEVVPKSSQLVILADGVDTTPMWDHFNSGRGVYV